MKGIDTSSTVEGFTLMLLGMHQEVQVISTADVSKQF